MIMLTQFVSGTLSVAGIAWSYQKYNGRVAFCYRHHAIVFDCNSGYYQIKERGETVFAARSVSECLQNAAEYVWDYYASQITPSWETN